MANSCPTPHFQDRTGLRPDEMPLEPQAFTGVCLTPAAQEALSAAGARLLPESDPRGPISTHTVLLGVSVPEGLVATRFAQSDGLGIRMKDDAPFDDEIGHAYWEQAHFLPCPECGAPLVWYEAGFVPGYRVCARFPYHHVLIRPSRQEEASNG